MSEQEKTWKELSTDVDLYKFYLELLIKFATFSFAITGAIMSWYFLHPNTKLMKFTLLLPLIINSGFVIICGFGIQPAVLMKKEFEETCSKLGLTNPYDMEPLIFIIYVFLISSIIIDIGLIFLLFIDLPLLNQL